MKDVCCSLRAPHAKMIEVLFSSSRGPGGDGSNVPVQSGGSRTSGGRTELPCAAHIRKTASISCAGEAVWTGPMRFTSEPTSRGRVLQLLVAIFFRLRFRGVATHQ